MLVSNSFPEKRGEGEPRVSLYRETPTGTSFVLVPLVLVHFESVYLNTSLLSKFSVDPVFLLPHSPVVRRGW